MNPRLRAAARPALEDAESLFARLRRGDRAALGRAITLVESDHPSHGEIADRLLDLALRARPPSLRVGITGVPGVGKSTFIEALGCLLADSGRRIAVLAVDPTSANTRGSILGDKSRMPRLAAHPNAFVRPSPTSGSLGGVAYRTREAGQLCEAAGYGLLLFETVGVGQSETAVRQLVDVLLLLALPGSGDELQGMKRGVMETADVIAVTKADGENRPRAELTRAQIEGAVNLYPAGPLGRPRLALCSAKTGEGVEAVWGHVESLSRRAKETGILEARRAGQAVAWMDEIVRQAMESSWFAKEAVRRRRAELVERVRVGRTTPRAAARELLETIRAER